MRFFIRLFMVITAFLFTTGFGKDTPNLAKSSPLCKKDFTAQKSINQSISSFAIKAPEKLNFNYINTVGTTIRHFHQVNKDLSILYVAKIYTQPIILYNLSYKYRYRYNTNT